MKLALALLVLISLIPAAAAGSAEAPEMTDAAGDAGPGGTNVPGQDDIDLLAAWFEAEDLDSVDLKIQLAAAPVRINWDVGQHFQHAGVDYYTGGFRFLTNEGVYLCRVPDGEDFNCQDSTEGGIEGATIRVVLPKSFMDNATVGHSLDIQEGWSVQCAGAFVPGLPVGFGQCAPFDATPAGTPYVIAKGAVPVDDNATSGTGVGLGGAVGNASVKPTSTTAPEEAAATPGAGVVAVILGAVAVAAMRRR